MGYVVFPIILLLVMVAMLLLRAFPIFSAGTLIDFLLGKDWHPLKGNFGLLPFITGTFWVTFGALLVAVPPCLLAAIYLSEYALRTTRTFVKPLLDLLAGIPSVIYGAWGVLVVVPWVQNVASPILRSLFSDIPLFQTTNYTGFSVMSGALVLAIMVAPIIVSVVWEVFQALPAELRQASLALGATQWETIWYVVLPKSRPGILAGIGLAFSRAFGETMAVLMVVGNVVQIPHSLFDAAYPLTALIANNYGEMMSIPMYDAALMGAALVLMLLVMLFNSLSAFYLNRITGG